MAKSWQNDIAGCFGITDLIFAGHKLDEDRAFDLLIRLREENIGWNVAKAEIESWLSGKEVSAAHVNEQLAKIEGAYKFWLLD